MIVQLMVMKRAGGSSARAAISAVAAATAGVASGILGIARGTAAAVVVIARFRRLVLLLLLNLLLLLLFPFVLCPPILEPDFDLQKRREIAVKLAFFGSFWRHDNHTVNHSQFG